MYFQSVHTMFIANTTNITRNILKCKQDIRLSFHPYSEFVMLVCAVGQTGDLLMDDLREAALDALHLQDDVIMALVVLFFIL